MFRQWARRTKRLHCLPTALQLCSVFSATSVQCDKWRKQKAGAAGAAWSAFQTLQKTFRSDSTLCTMKIRSGLVEWRLWQQKTQNIKHKQNKTARRSTHSNEFLYFWNGHKIPRYAGKYRFIYAQKKTMILAIARIFLWRPFTPTFQENTINGLVSGTRSRPNGRTDAVCVSSFLICTGTLLRRTFWYYIRTFAHCM